VKKKTNVVALAVTLSIAAVSGCNSAEPDLDDGPDRLADYSDGPLETRCGPTEDLQDVEQYDGLDGVSQAFVNLHERPVGQIQWLNDLATRYTNPGDVNDARWCSGTQISADLFLTAGHCFDVDVNGWTTPRTNGTTTPITPQQMAGEMQVNFGYQRDATGTLRTATSYRITQLVEYRPGGLDFAVIRLANTPGNVWGTATIVRQNPAPGATLAIIGHPDGRPKQVDIGNMGQVVGTSLRYSDVDTLAGNSGSGVLEGGTGNLVAVHTSGGCTMTGGSNRGVAIETVIDNSPSVAAIACHNPAGASSAEVCDGQDNDCDGVVDDGVQDPCGGCGGNATPAGVQCAQNSGSDWCFHDGLIECNGAQCCCKLFIPLTECKGIFEF